MIPPENTIVDAHEGLHMEILEPATRKVWQTLQPVTRADYLALDNGPDFIKVGLGRGAMDESYFRRSPGADEDGPMETMEFGGHGWSYCARPSSDPPTLPGGEKGPRQLTVDKHHTLIFHAGRSLPLIRLPDGSEYVHTIQGDEALLLPDGWTCREIELREQLRVDLPSPTTAFFFPNRDSFQGPVHDLQE